MALFTGPVRRRLPPLTGTSAFSRGTSSELRGIFENADPQKQELFASGELTNDCHGVSAKVLELATVWKRISTTDLRSSLFLVEVLVTYFANL